MFHMKRFKKLLLNVIKMSTVLAIGYGIVYGIQEVALNQPHLDYNKAMEDCNSMGKQRVLCKAYWLGHADASGVILEPEYNHIKLATKAERESN